MPVSATLVSVCFVVNGDKLLMMEHRGGFAKGFWSVLGGRMEPGETPAQAAVRELQEESGLTATELRQAGYVWLYQVNAITGMNLFVVTGFTGEIAGSDEGTPVWVPLADLPHLKHVPYLRPLLDILAPNAFLEGTLTIDSALSPLAIDLRQHRMAESRRITR